MYNITLQHAATRCNTLKEVWRCGGFEGVIKCAEQHTATHCYTLQHTETHCNTLQNTETHGNTLQHAATHCNTLQHAQGMVVWRYTVPSNTQ